VGNAHLFLTQRSAELSAEEGKEIRAERVEFDAQMFFSRAKVSNKHEI
jgi:hypothetical protein